MKKRCRPPFLTWVILICAMLYLFLQGWGMLMFVPSGSMEPTYYAGDFLYGQRHVEDFQRGEVYVFTGADGRLYIKRLIAVGGDYVWIERSGVYLNGHLLEEQYTSGKHLEETRKYQVPKGSLLFLGDHRDSSYDSRYWENPYIAEQEVLAVVKKRLFSIGRQRT